MSLQGSLQPLLFLLLQFLVQSRNFAAMLILLLFALNSTELSQLSPLLQLLRDPQ